MCEINCDIMKTIFAALSINCQLVKLSLIGFSFNDEHFKLLEKFIVSAKYLVSLDLSWSRFKL